MFDLLVCHLRFDAALVMPSKGCEPSVASLLVMQAPRNFLLGGILPCRVVTSRRPLIPITVGLTAFTGNGLLTRAKRHIGSFL